MAVLGNRATGVLDMLIEGFRRSGQTMEQPNMTQVAPTPLQQAMNRPVSRLTSTGDISTIMPDGGGVAQTAVPLIQDLARGRVLNPINPMQDMGQPMPVSQALEQDKLRAAAQQSQATPDTMGMEKLASDAARAVEMGAAESTDPTIRERIQSYFGGRENMLRLAMAFNTMRLEPDAQLTAALSKQLENRGVSTRAKQIAQSLRAKGTPAAILAADYIERTGDYKGGYKMYRESGKITQISGRDLNKQANTTVYDNDAMYNVNTVTGQVSQVGGGGTTVNIGPEEGSLSTDYTFLRNSQGEKIYKDGLPIAVAVPGSPAAQDAQKAEEKRVARDAQRGRAGGTVIQDIQRGLDLIPDLTGLEAQGGILGANARKIAENIEGTITNRISKFKESALSNVGLDTLQQMRENSPTGGALGQVPIQQQKRLEQVLGSLDVTQELSVLEQNMKRVINIYLDIIHGSKAERRLLVEKEKLTAQENDIINQMYYELPFDALGRAIQEPEGEVARPDYVSPEVWDEMTDKEKQAFR